MKTEIPCPVIIKQYNASMGGIDLSDMQIKLYQIQISRKKRLYLKIIFYCIDITETNAWLLYRCNYDLLGKQEKRTNSVRKFIPQIAITL